MTQIKVSYSLYNNDEELKPNFMVPEIKHDLSVVNGVVCRGSRVVVSIALQKRVVELNYRAHQEVSKAKHFLRQGCREPGSRLLTVPSRPTSSQQPANQTIRVTNWTVAVRGNGLPRPLS